MPNMAKLRDFLNHNPAVVGVICVGVAITGLVWMIMRSGDGGGGDSSQRWWYDTVTQEYFTDSKEKISPILSPADNEAVLAYFFACGECTKALVSDGGARFLGYYEKYTPEGRKEAEARQAQGLGGMMLQEPAGRLYSIDGETWFEHGSLEAMKLIAAPRSTCPQPQDLRPCVP